MDFVPQKWYGFPMKKRSSKNGQKFSGKIKTEHAIIEGLYEILAALTMFDAVHSIIPGRIMRRGSSQPLASLGLTIKTPTGWKAIGKSKGSQQDFFIVTDEPEEIPRIIKLISGKS